MLGTIANGVAIVAGGSAGLLLKKGVSEPLKNALDYAMGIAIVVVGANGIITNMITVGEGGALVSSGELILIFSLALGAALGTSLRIEERLNGLGSWVENTFHLTGFAASFVSGSLIYCVGAMAIVGSLNDGLQGDPSVLYIKSTLDGITSIVLAATLGPGVIFSALPVMLYQGSITLLASVLEPLLAGAVLGQICAVGFAMVACIGINFFGKLHIAVANLLPALLVPPLWVLLQNLVAQCS